MSVASPSARKETIGVLHVAFHVALWSGIVVSLEASGTSDPNRANAADTPPFVQRFQELDNTDQRMVRGIQEGLSEAERRRVAEGAWPKVEALAGDGIPPFAPDPIDKDRYAWRLYAARGVANYVGVPRASDRPIYVVIVTEPDPGTPNDPSIKVDEVHHRLSSGMLVHTGIFVGRDFKDAKAPVPSVPFDEGWKQVLAGPASVLGR